MINRILYLSFFCLILSSCGHYATTFIRNSDFVSLSEDVAVSKSEVSNRQYTAFLQAIQNADAALYERCRIRPEGWARKLKEKDAGESLKKLYHDHPAYEDYPVCNITFEGALAYCEWLTTMQGDNGSYRFRLPTHSEWKVMRSSVDVDLSTDEGSNTQEYNFNLKFTSGYVADGSMFAAPIKGCPGGVEIVRKKYRQGSKGMYHVVGNVHEMLSSGEYVGGSWDTYPSEVDQLMTISSYDPTIGFRVIRERIK